MRPEPHLKLPAGAGAAVTFSIGCAFPPALGMFRSGCETGATSSTELPPRPCGWRTTAGVEPAEPPAFGIVRTTILATGPRPPIAGGTCADSTAEARWIVKPKRGLAVPRLAPVVPPLNSARH